MQLTESPILRKPVSAVVWLPLIGGLTPMARKMFNVLLHKTQQEIREFDAKGSVIPAEHWFSMPVSDLVKPLQTGKSELHALVKPYLYEMTEMRLNWEAPDASRPEDDLIFDSAGEQLVFGTTHLIGDALITKKDGRAFAKWSFPPSIIRALRHSKMYSQVPIEEIAKLESYEAIALYDICCRYKTHPAKKTSVKDPQWWVQALTSKVPKIDPATGQPKWREWRKVLDLKVKKAIEEINEKTDINVEVNQLKTGKQVTGVEFFVSQKTSSVVESSPKISPDSLEQAARLGLQINELNVLLKNGEDESLLRAAMSKMEARDQSSIENKQAYFKKILLELKSLTTTPGRTAGLTQQTILPAATSPHGPVDVALSPKEEMRSQARIELLAQPVEIQREFAMAALSNLKKKDQVNSSVVQKVSAGNWQSAPLIMSEMVKIFAAERFGDLWEQVQNEN